MPNYNYKTVRYSTYDEQTPAEIIATETEGNWNYYDTVQLHENLLWFVFRRPDSGSG